MAIAIVETNQCEAFDLEAPRKGSQSAFKNKDSYLSLSKQYVA
jgi:hypothetical protein